MLITRLQLTSNLQSNLNLLTHKQNRQLSSTPMKGKTSLVSTLVHCVLKICSKSKLKEEINRIKKFLLDNEYPEAFVLKQISKKITQFSTPKRFGPDKCPVYFRVSCTGKTSLTLAKNVRTAVENCYGSVTVRTVFVSRQMLPTSRKDVLPAHQKSSVIYKYKCHCDSQYAGRISQIALDSMFRNGFDNTQAPNEYNRTERGTKNNPLRNAIQPLDSIHWRMTNALPTTIKTNFPLWTLREVVFVSLCSKPATSEYGDLIYVNGKSLFTLSICSSRLQAVATCPIKSRVTISHLIGQRSIAWRTFEIAL